MNVRGSIVKRTCLGRLSAGLTVIGILSVLAQPTAQAATRSEDPLFEPPRQHITHKEKGSMTMSENKTSPAGAAEMAAAKTITMKVLAIGSWTAKATPETIPR